MEKEIGGIFLCGGFQRVLTGEDGPNLRFKRHMRRNWTALTGLDIDVYDSWYFCACSTGQKGRTTAISLDQLVNEDGSCPYDGYWFGWPARDGVDGAEEWHSVSLDWEWLLKKYREKSMKKGWYQRTADAGEPLNGADLEWMKQRRATHPNDRINVGRHMLEEDQDV